MAETAISQLPAATDVAGAQIPVLQGGATRRASVNLLGGAASYALPGLTGGIARTDGARWGDATSILDYPNIAADGSTDDRTALQAAITTATAAGKAVYIPQHVTLRVSDAVILRSGARLWGPGRILFVPTQDGRAAVDIGNGASTSGNSDISDIEVRGVRFECTSDFRFLSFIRVDNEGFDIDQLNIEDNTFAFTWATTVNTADNWAIAFTGEYGTTKSNIRVVGNRLYGLMQLTSGGGNSAYSDVLIANNMCNGGKANVIALSRAHGGADTDVVNRRISIVDNVITCDRTTAIFVGMDNDSSTSGMTWEDIAIERNVININNTVGGSPIGILFRGAGSSNGFNRRIRIVQNTIHVSSNATISVTRSASAAAPALLEAQVVGNRGSGGQMLFDSLTSGLVMNNTCTQDMRFIGGTIATVIGNTASKLRADGSGASLVLSKNTWRAASSSEFLVDLNSATGVTNAVTSTDDTFVYSLATGAGGALMRIRGVGTNTTRLINPTVNDFGRFAALFSYADGNVVGAVDGLRRTGTATLASGNTTVVVTHGFGGHTPAKVFIQPISATGSSTRWWVTTIGAAQFTINVDAAPGSAVTFAWAVEA